MIGFSMTNSSLQDDYILSAAYYDFVERYRTRGDVDFFVQAARQSGGPVLELGAGTGRVLIPTARAGIDITGLDSSSAMLDRCRENLRTETAAVRSRITLAEGDLRTFGLKKQFSLITTPFRPFQHLLTVADQLSCLERVRQHLAPDGRFILDIFNPSLPNLTADNMGQELGEEAVAVLPDGRRAVRRIKIVDRDLINQIIRSEIVYYVTHPDGRKERLVQPLAMRYLFHWEVEHLLARAGLAVEHIYGDYDRSPFGEKHPGELIFVTRPAVFGKGGAER
jgi:SAM-dependent methyltransferase